MNYEQVRSYSVPLLTSKVGNVSLQATRPISGSYVFDLWFNPSGTDKCFNVGLDFDSRPNREKLYNFILKMLPNEIEESPDEYKETVRYFISEIQKPRTKSKVLKVFQNTIKEISFSYEKLGSIKFNHQTCTYQVNLEQAGNVHITFGYTGNTRYISVGFVIGSSNFGFRDVLGNWSLEGIQKEIRRQLDFRAISSKEFIARKIYEAFDRDKEQLSHLLYRFNNNLKLV